MTYNDLSIEDKFWVVKRFVGHRAAIAVREALGHRIWFNWQDIDTFFEKGCRDMQPGTKSYALRKARKCFYCETLFLNPKDPDYAESPDRKTVDHFFSAKHRGDKNRLVIACDSCNNWKGHQHPQVVIKRIVSGQIPKRVRMDIATALKIERILMDFNNDVGPNCYYI